MGNRLGCCGLNCENCPVFIATANNDNDLRQKTAKEWSVLYADILEEALKPSDIECKGCHSKSTSFLGCKNCPIRKCCTEKNFDTCASCDEYGSCGMLKGFFTFHHQQAKDNLDELRASLKIQ